jgi:shikimate dehydrogenase
MAKAVPAALRNAGFSDGIVVARNENAGPALAGRYGFRWTPDLGPARPQMIVNATPVGMTGGPDESALPVPDAVVDAAHVVFDVVALPVETPLIRRARERGIDVITGAEVIALQAARQFELYTGVRPSDALVRWASKQSRG